MSFIERARVERMIEEMEAQRKTAEMNFHRFDAALMALQSLLDDVDGNASDIAPTGEETASNDDTIED